MGGEPSLREGFCPPEQLNEDNMKAHKLIQMGAILGLSLLLGAPAYAQTDRTTSGGTRGQFNEKDYRFAIDAARGGQEEVQLGELARQKGVNQSVRTFGERMVADHSKANDELKELATKKGASLPTQLSYSERSTVEDLQKATGTDFDKSYAKAMVKDHKTDVKDFQKAANNLTDPDLRAFAQKTVGTLQEHLRMAQDMENTVQNEK
jgi:putative membrane protein